MKRRKYLIFIILTVLGITNGCDVLDPEDSNVYDLNDVKTRATYAEGILIHAYRDLNTAHTNFTLAYASDDAVNNDPDSNVKDVVSGGWTSSLNPFNQWNTAYESIFYINSFLEEMNDIEWYAQDETSSALFASKLRGEAFGLRAWNYFHLLQAHAGEGKNGEMLGVPIVDEVLTIDNAEAYQIPRSSFEDLVDFILADCDRALALIPDRWVDTGDGSVDRALGKRNTNRINGITVRLIKAKTLLYAASPAYSTGTYTYQMAAQAAADIMNINNGLDNVASGNVVFYNNPSLSDNADSDPEVLWYSNRMTNNTWEEDNYPPSLYGEGLTNPTQDLVNAFPLVDGTPTPASKINSSDPYSGRDPRLSKFILYNGSDLGRAGITINTTAGSQDALGSADINATKTGYYLKKFMNTSDVNLDPRVDTEGLHYYTYARYTDVLLMFAEAANEAAGPDGNIGGYTAREVINAIRDRAGITVHDYVNGLDKSQMAELIRNERRIEMCFENQRFWDLRRWQLTTKMKEAVSGVEVSSDGSTYNYLQVEPRNYSDYQIYGPIPYDETLKYNLIQNMGWQ
nr:RagB/SusD family nutrient uptake outer membrane protein [Sunxiuqinia sp.]